MRPGAPDMCDPTAEGIAAAKAVCRSCPVVDECAAWLRSLEHPPLGVVAGICFNGRGNVRRNPKRPPKIRVSPPPRPTEQELWVIARFERYALNDLIVTYAARYRVSLPRAAQAVGLVAAKYRLTQPERTTA